MNRVINLNTLDGVNLITFPDGQDHVRLENVKDGDWVDVICSITSASKLFQLALVADAIFGVGANARVLFVPYLMGARYDRRMVEGDSFDLSVVASIINHCNFQRVDILDAHSPMSIRLIDRSYNILPNLSSSVFGNDENTVYICPDKGAGNRVPKNAKLVAYCSKERDVMTGHLKVTVPAEAQEICYNKNCVIVDDICDGGRTFIEIAKQIQAFSLTLIVTHGIFSNGFYELNKYFDRIITTNSIPSIEEVKNKKLTVINIYQENYK